MNTKDVERYWELISLFSNTLKEMIPMTEKLDEYMKEMNKLLEKDKND